MSLETWIIGAVRLAGSLPVLRWPLAGALLAIAVDFSDLFLMNWIDLGGLGDYQRFDKLADLAYMATFALTALRWRGLDRGIAMGLLAFRLLGVAAFELTGARVVLMAFPNVFEFWFLFVAARKHFGEAESLSLQRSVRWLALLTVLKLGQEYVLHYGRWLDNYVATEVAADIWRWVVGAVDW